MFVSVALNSTGTGINGDSEFSLTRNLLDILALLFLSANVAARCPVLFQYPVVLKGIVFAFLLSLFLPFFISRSLKILLFVFACSLPLYGSHSYHIHNIVFELFVSALALVFLVQNRFRGKVKTVKNILPALLICYILLAGFSLLLLPFRSILGTLQLWGWQDFLMFIVQVPPDSVLYSVAAVNRLVLFGVFIFQLTNHSDRDSLYRFVFSGLVSGAVLASFIGILSHYHLLPLDWFRETVIGGRRLQSVFGNPGWFAEFISVSIPFILLGFLNSKIHKITKMMLFGVLIICEMAILLTCSRTGWLIYPLVLVSCWLVFYLFKRIEAGTLTWGGVGQAFIKVILSVPLTIIVSYFLVTGIVQHKDSGTATMLEKRFSKITNPAVRKQIWQESMAIGREAPVFGLGYESYKHQVITLASISDSLYSSERQIKNIDYDTPHNQYLQILISNGVVGLLFWLILLSYAVVVLFYDLKRNKKYFNIAVLLSMIAFHQYGLAQSMQYVSVIWFLIFLSFGYTMTLNEGVLPKAIRHSAKLIVLLLIFLVVTGGAIYARNAESRLFAQKYGLHIYAADQDQDQYLGFYPKEDWGKQGVFRWTGQRAIIIIDKPGVVGLDFSCNSPGLSVNPIVLNVLFDGRLLDQITFWDNKMISRDFFISPECKRGVRRIELQVSRTWNPWHDGISADYRNLGVAVSDPKYKGRVPTEDIGFYDWQMEEGQINEQKEMRELKYRWTRQEAVLVLDGQRKTPISMVLKSEQPHLNMHPVDVQFFQKDKKISSVRLVDNKWNTVQLPQQLQTDQPLVMTVNRTWNPKREGYFDDPRDLGVAVALMTADETGETVMNKDVDRK